MEIIEKPQMQIIGITCRTSNSDGSAQADIPALWEQFQGSDFAAQIPNRVSDEVIALYCDYEGDHTKPYSIVIGYPVSSLEEIPAGLVGKTVPAARFALHEATGDFPKNVVDAWNRVWSSDLSRTYVGDYEVYGQKFAQNQAVDILVAVK